MHGIIFEAAGVAVSLGNEDLITLVVSLLARYLSVRESNLRYLALENIGRLSQSGYVAKAVAKHQKTIISCMSDADISIRASALNLLFTTANIDSAADIVEELLSAIKRSDYSMREELVLKAAVLAERFPPSPEWYIDSMINLVITAGDAVTNEIWHSIVHLVSNKKELHSYAAQKVVNVLQDDTANEPFIRCAAYILGEFGDENDTSTFDQYKLLHKYFPVVSIQAKAMLLNCYEKMALRMEDHELQAVKETLELEANTLDTEIQQRATEYKELLRHPDAAKIALQPLPLWEMRDSVLLRKLVEKEVSIDEARERPVWMTENENVNKLKETEIPDMTVLQNEEPVTPSTEVQPTGVIDLLGVSK
jgi:AP-2 complex subunit alpha